MSNMSETSSHAVPDETVLFGSLLQPRDPRYPGTYITSPIRTPLVTKQTVSAIT